MISAGLLTRCSHCVPLPRTHSRALDPAPRYAVCALLTPTSTGGSLPRFSRVHAPTQQGTAVGGKQLWMTTASSLVEVLLVGSSYLEGAASSRVAAAERCQGHVCVSPGRSVWVVDVGCRDAPRSPPARLLVAACALKPAPALGLCAACAHRLHLVPPADRSSWCDSTTLPSVRVFD